MQNQCILFSFSFRFASYLNVLVISQGSATTYLRCGEIYYVTNIETISTYVQVLASPSESRRV